jgi:hypothetical protein
MYDEMYRNEMPGSITQFERLADHYGIGSIWMGLYAFEEIRRGRMRWEEWLPDGLHPTSRGSLSYAESVINFLEKELLTQPNDIEMKKGALMPFPLDPKNWEHSTQYDLSDVILSGPWSIRRYPHLSWIDQVLYTSAIGASISFQFEGRGLSLGFDFGKDSCEFRYRFDDGEWRESQWKRPEWCPPQEGWYRSFLLTEDLEYGKHSFELEVIHGNSPECTGTNCRLGMIGVIR